MNIFGIAGWSGSGKTTLIVNLLPELTKRGISVSTVKHAHHEFDIDKPGKDSFVHRMSGATEVIIGSKTRWALMHELRGAPEPSLPELISHMEPVDLHLVEGFKWEDHAKLEVHRPSVGKPLLQPDDSTIRAIASNVTLGGMQVPVMDVDDIAGIADFILDQCQIKAL
ncbi:MAG: molybdopterin-guanine dinucleotide biosynthesis protein B [Rhodospirillaceae bacterium]|jgi:molybdopterin-guanine dinucleotide biosynthesis adapter protein|nr:molybdopterin-guanine dinucleotide biosynthesis protein B [Rhodospirillaceae bacterium]MBT3886763.1 molybdopterin-guanine dinucleotide biosynthesis protein B [Rhodospirillaceae bacterium]MBT4116448.1 molybdopterin-guanine dinucleotide biosynthesis protein B [Rhodospirillaceae bacterium]MBT4670856.1 molybdopterin-guanine dinucleotide biosynthesis protein B [Rhodospirillaceae bacterium]MBT4717887.1 molybdopterin-guanine dinucleotide biosynthesis protein B [Rhodospirillaceae bacterium]